MKNSLHRAVSLLALLSLGLLPSALRAQSDAQEPALHGTPAPAATPNAVATPAPVLPTALPSAGGTLTLTSGGSNYNGGAYNGGAIVVSVGGSINVNGGTTVYPGGSIIYPGGTIIPTYSFTANAQQGQPFLFRWPGAVTTAATVFSATHLPAGLTMDSATGVISGTPNQVGFFAVQLVDISNPYGGNYTERSLGLTVAPIVPVATLSIASPRLNVAEGQPGVFTVTLSAAQPRDLRIHYTVRGDAVNGADYVLLTGARNIKAGRTVAAIRIIPRAASGGTAPKSVKLTLAPGAGYTVGTTGFVKLELVSGQ